MAYVSTTNCASGVVEQSKRHAKTVSRYLAEQFRTVENPSFDMFKSFARDYVNVCLISDDNNAASDFLSVSDQLALAQALHIDLPVDAAAEAKPFDDVVTQLYALY